MSKLDRCGWAGRRIRRGLDRRASGRVLRWITLVGNRSDASPRAGEASRPPVTVGDGDFPGPAANEPGLPDDEMVLRFSRRG